jgi:hypothetical protein
MAEKALTAVVQEVYVQGVSSPKGDRNHLPINQNTTSQPKNWGTMAINVGLGIRTPPSGPTSQYCAMPKSHLMWLARKQEKPETITRARWSARRNRQSAA